MWERAQKRREVVPDSGASHQEGSVLFSGCARVWYHMVTHGGQAE